MRYKALTIVIMSIILWPLLIPCNASQTVKVINNGSLLVEVNGNQVNFDQPPYLESGRTMVPFRAIAEALGAKVEWDSATKKITILGVKKVELVLGSSKAAVDGIEINLDVPAKSIVGRTMVPLRFIGESLGAEVKYVSQQTNSKFIMVVAGGNQHTLGITEDGSLWAWGDNCWGEIGDGSKINRFAPVKIMNDVKDIAAGYGISFAVKNDGTLWGWGNNYYGRLGDGTTMNKAIPVKIMDGVIDVAAGRDHGLAIKEDGTLWAWGRNECGQLGDNTKIDKLVPVQIMSEVKNVAAGDSYSMAIKKDGSLWSWGNNFMGELGDGRGCIYDMKYENDGSQIIISEFITMPMEKNIPLEENQIAPVEILQGVKSISVLSHHTLAIKEDGTLWAWGYNENGQLGDGTKKSNAIPVKIMSNVRSIAAGQENSLAIKEDGTLWAWGDLGIGQMGDGKFFNAVQSDLFHPSPIQLNISQVKNISTSTFYIQAIKEDGSLWAWGENTHGQLGINNRMPYQDIPTQVICNSTKY